MSTPPLSLHAWLRYDTVRRLVPGGVGSVLEIGGGLGSFGALLARRFDYVGLEPDPDSFAVAVRRVGALGTMLNETAESFEATEPFDLVCAFEVLEHVQDDREVLEGWLRHLRPGGHVLVSVPFGRDRFGAWDRRAGHYRRYDRSDIVGVLGESGLREIETAVYGFPLGNATELVRNIVARRADYPGAMSERTAASGRQLQPPPWTAAATRIASAPFRLAQRPLTASRLGTGLVARGRA